MEQVVLQPAADPTAVVNYKNTITNRVSLNRIRPYISTAEFDRLCELYPSKDAAIWGVVPRKNNRNKKRWERIQVGDVVLFSAQKRIFSSGVITFKTHNKSLAKQLWGNDPDGETWEYIYFLDELKTQDIKQEVFNKIAAYSKGNIIRSFEVLGELKSLPILTALALFSPTFFSNVSEKAFEIAVHRLEHTPLDVERTRLERTEQTFLRETLFSNKRIATCCICGEEYPVEFLVAAHTKKRAHCDATEKRDVKNIVAPMCKFGCDDLYEKGYIGVIDGKVEILKRTPATAQFLHHLSTVEGKVCSAWRNETEEYFRWHVSHHTKS